jgi:hypothetical protein
VPSELPHKKSYFVKIRCLKKDVTLQWTKKPAGGAYDEPTKQTRITGKDSATLSKSRKKENQTILNEFVATTGYHRKYANRLLKQGCQPPKLSTIHK